MSIVSSIPRKHARSTPAATFARVNLRNFCLHKRPSFLASRRFAKGKPDTDALMTYLSLNDSEMVHFLYPFCNDVVKAKENINACFVWFGKVWY
jgi:hypothetical protein